jgi:hypothetical protein
MAAPRTASEARTGGPRASLPRLRDEIIDLYLDWREESAALGDAYACWGDASADDKAACFAAFTAALDREEAAARTYAEMLTNGESLLRSW